MITTTPHQLNYLASNYNIKCLRRATRTRSINSSAQFRACFAFTVVGRVLFWTFGSN